MSKLRRERRDKRQRENPLLNQQKNPSATPAPSLWQKGITLTWEVGLALLAFWGFLRGLAPFIAATASYVGFVIVVILSVSAHFILKKYPLRWVTDSQEIFLSSLPPKVIVGLSIVAISLLAPRVIEKFFPPPTIEISFQGPSLYKPGFEVDGIKWEKDFSEYTLRIKNGDKKADILDLRAEVRLLAGFVKSSTVSLQGVEDVQYSPSGLREPAGKINEQGQMYEAIKSYSTNQMITAGKMFPDGGFTSKFILKRVTPDSQSPPFSFVKLKFLYVDFWGEPVVRWIAYRVHIKTERGMNIISVDSANPIPGKDVSSGFSVFFDEPLSGGQQYKIPLMLP